MTTRQRSITSQELVAAVEMNADRPTFELMGRVAESYARLGLRVIPLHHPTQRGCSCSNASCGNVGKHPRTRGGVRDATTSIETIRAWWFSHPYSNIGIATGHLVDVIDIDSQGAQQAVADLQAAQRLPSILAMSATGRPGGGTHLFIAASGAGCKPPPVDDLDFKGSGGYVVAAPSRHTTGTRYSWLAVAMPVGDTVRGRALGRMPWEDVDHTASARPSQGEHEYANQMLARQVRRISSAPPGQRHKRLLKAAYNLAAVVADGWIGEGKVTQSLLSAYQVAGGENDGSARRAVISGLHKGRNLPLPKLGPRFAGADANEVTRAIRAWLASSDFEAWKASTSNGPTITERRLQVLRRILDLAEATGQTCIPVAQRDAQLFGAFASKASAAKALDALIQLPVLSIDLRQQRGPGSAAKFRLHYPPGSTPTCDASDQDTVGVPEDLTTSWAPASQDAAVVTHPVWGIARGHGRGLTHKDRALFANIAPDADTPIKTTAWAKQAGWQRESLTRACNESERSLVGLGLVGQVERGVLALTPLGAAIAAAVQGQADLLVLDDLARSLGVAERAEQREARIATERKMDRENLVIGRPSTSAGREPFRGMVERLMSGWLATERVPALLAEVLGPDAARAASRLCGALDLTEETEKTRAAVEGVLSVEGWLGTPLETAIDPALAHRLARWLSDGVRFDETDVDTDLIILVAAWWRAARPAPADEQTYDDKLTHGERVALAHIRSALRVPRNATPPSGYVKVPLGACLPLAS